MNLMVMMMATAMTQPPVMVRDRHQMAARFNDQQKPGVEKGITIVQVYLYLYYISSHYC